MNVLSVDWDYFFPNTVQFDWGHRESPLYMDMLWTLRVHDVSLGTEKSVLDILVPDEKLLKDFWKRVCPKEPDILAITESHADLFRILKTIGNAEVYNFDAHHDLYYNGSLPKKPECGSWAGHALKKGMISKYKIIFPPWRKSTIENIPSDWENKMVQMIEIPKQLPKFDVVFICRSSAWTPSWSDDKWLEFIGYWKKFHIWQYKSVAPYVMKARSPDLKEARKLREDPMWDVIKTFQGKEKEAVKNGKGMDT